jgi:hypothetical protein
MRTPPAIQGRSIELGNIDTAAPYRMYETIGAAERNTAQEYSVVNRGVSERPRSFETPFRLTLRLRSEPSCKGTAKVAPQIIRPVSKGRAKGLLRMRPNCG